MTTEEVARLLKDLKYRDWSFLLDESTGLHLKVWFVADGCPQVGRKWKLSRHMTKSEIVQTALKAVLVAEEHEAREKFLYRERPIFGPHFDVDALWEISGRVDVREPPTP